jgi:hypothetical protein
MVDYDDIVARIAGSEGGPRYVRLGIVLTMVGLLCAISVLTLPIYQIESDSGTYSSMLDARDDQPLGVLNPWVIDHANVALAGCILTAIMGTLFILEGRRLINLRRYLVWHAEARATALYSLAALMSIIGLAGGASLWSFTTSMPSASAGGVTVETDFTSPAASVVVLGMGFISLGLLFMVYYSTVLSVHRGGVTPRTRQLARLTMIIALLAFFALMMLRSGTVVEAEVELGVLGTDATATFTVPITMARADYFADFEEGNVSMGFLDFQLELVGWLLLITLMIALGGCVGIAAHSLGGESLRVRRTVSLPTIAGLACILVCFIGLSAMGTTSSAAEEALDLPDVSSSIGGAIPLALVGAIVVLGAAILYLKTAGRSFVIEALAFWIRPEVPETPPVPEGEVPSEDLMFGDEPLEVTPMRREGFMARLPSPIRKFLPAIVVVAILLMAIVAYAGIRSGGGGDGSDQKVPVDIPNLPSVQWSHEFSGSLSEGGSITWDAIGDSIDQDMSSRVYFFNQVTLTLEWQDEPDTGFLINRWENQPDRFSISLIDDGELDVEGTEGTNPHGGWGNIQVTWSSAEYWISYGNLSLVSTGDFDVISDLLVEATVTLIEAGDFQSPLGRTQSDNGNDYTATVFLEGTNYTEDS